MMLIDFLTIIALIILNGLFAVSELAVVTARHSRLKAMAARDRYGAKSALVLASNPGTFLSAVQVGITLVVIVNGTYSGETYGILAYSYLRGLGISEAVAGPLGFGSVIAVVTYLSVVIGELVPKNLALRNAETIACAVAPSMNVFAKIAAPIVWLLDISAQSAIRLFGSTLHDDTSVTDEEIKALIAEAESAGVLERSEREMISAVMRFADRAVVGLMTQRTAVEWIDINETDDKLRKRFSSASHALLPVAEGSVDAMIGVVKTRQILATMLTGEPLDIRGQMRKAPIVPEMMDALDVLDILRKAEVPMALVHDEYGHFEGLVTPADILEAIVGVFKSDTDGEEAYAVERSDGSWLLSGRMPVDEMADTIGLSLRERRGFETVAGFILTHLKRIPTTGERVLVQDWCFEVVDLDGRRIDKILATRKNSTRHPIS